MCVIANIVVTHTDGNKIDGIGLGMHYTATAAFTILRLDLFGTSIAVHLIYSVLIKVPSVFFIIIRNIRKITNRGIISLYKNLEYF